MQSRARFQLLTANAQLAVLKKDVQAAFETTNAVKRQLEDAEKQSRGAASTQQIDVASLKLMLTAAATTYNAKKLQL